MTLADLRLGSGGRIDRSQPVRFIFNGAPYTGYRGDTLASALLANGVRLVGRSFKYHRPRGVMSAGAEEPNALVQLGAGARSEPNARATQIELYDGLVAASQNCWPAVGIDIGSLNDVASRILPAGFYYKTFMWPPGFWHFYEWFIRRAAGMGRAADLPDPDRYDHRYAHCDVLVVGAGPAGLAAALAAGKTGARVILCDEQNELGGSLLSRADSQSGDPWAEQVQRELSALPEVTLLPRTTAFGYYDHNMLALCERVADHMAEPGSGKPRQRVWHVRAKQVVLATGAIERPLVFCDNDRPGVMLAGAARTYLNRYGVACGRRAVLFTNNDSAYDAALELHAAGVEIAAVVDLRAETAGERAEAARERGLRVLSGHAITRVKGAHGVTGVEIARLSEDATGVSDKEAIVCDLVLMSSGWTPTIHLFSQSGGKLRYHDALGAFVPDRAAQAVRCAGAGNGAMLAQDCVAQGLAAGLAAATDCGFGGALPELPPLADEPKPAPMRHLWIVPSNQAPGTPLGRDGKHFVDHQNDVTAADVRLAAREGYRSVEHLKRYTTSGMGTDQGKTSNIAALAILADATGAEIPAVGTTTFRPPYTPVAMGAMAGRLHGALLDPERWTPMHRWHVRAGAVFEPVGQWQRARYYPQGRETMHEAVSREVRAARTTCGIFDGSTLGKIDIKGPDAGRFLDLVYTNTFSKLGVGRCRYGLMLREDGFVMDDGVTARLGEQHYLMSTTTGNAATVMGWLEDLLQMEWTDLRVRLTSVTEQFAVVALNGPFARKLLSELSDGIDLAPQAFPFMTWREGEVADIPARVFRISFTGELSYEIQVRASYGMALWNACIAAGEKYGVTPYGTEGMHVLRAEKGYIIVGQETDGTVSPHDLGLGGMVADAKPDFIGKRGLKRADLQRADRKQLVGLRLAEGEKRPLPEGAQLVSDPNASTPMPMIGYVTSSYCSPNVGAPIALALVTGGRARMGETVHAPLSDRTVEARIVEPCFFDPKGERLHA